MPNELLIYGLKGSPFVRKVQVALAEKSVAYDFEFASPFPAPDWFVELNPAKRIPVLRDRSIGEKGVAGTLPDSSVICAYLERKHPEPALYPLDAFECARALWIEEYADSELAGPVGMGMFRPMVMSKLSGGEPDVERARTTLREVLPAKFDYLEGTLAANGGAWMVGERFGIADIAVATQFVNFRFAGGTVDAKRWPALAAWVETLLGRESFARCIEEERKMIPVSEVTL